MKRILSCILAVIMMCSLCSCKVINFKNIIKPKENQEQTSADEEKISLNDYEVTLNVGETFQLEATANSQLVLKWKSSNENVALVNSNGVVTAAQTGVANITCYAENAVEAICTVTVRKTESIKVESVLPETEWSADFIFSHSSSDYLTEEEISLKISSMNGYSPSGNYAQDAINEIYARNGYIFTKANTSSYYNAKSWYTPNANFTTSDFNKYEKENIKLLKKFI